MKCTSALVLAASVMCLVLSPVLAQERTAGGSLSQEAGWTALKSKIETTDGNLKVLKANIAACNKVYKLYAPGENGADVQGCIANAQFEQLKADVTAFNNAVRHCGSLGMVYNGSSCQQPNVAAQSGASCSLQMTSPGNNAFRDSPPNYTCPNGYTTIRGAGDGITTTACARVVCN